MFNIDEETRILRNDTMEELINFGIFLLAASTEVPDEDEIDSEVAEACYHRAVELVRAYCEVTGVTEVAVEKGSEMDQMLSEQGLVHSKSNLLS